MTCKDADHPALAQRAGRQLARRWWIFVVVGCVLAAAYAGLALFKAHEYVTTPEQGAIEITPAELGLPFEDLTFHPVDDASITLRGWLIPRQGATRAIVLVHGRFEQRASHFDVAQELWQRGYTVLTFDLRGHGDSDTAVCTYGLKESRDAAGAVEFLVTRGYNPGAIGVLGWSLGGTSAILALGATDSIGAVVSDSAYANWEPLLARNALRPGLKLAMRAAYGIDLEAIRPGRAIAESGRPVLVIHGERDNAVPVGHAAALRRAAPDLVEVWTVADAGHTQAFALHREEYVERVSTFFGAELGE